MYTGIVQGAFTVTQLQRLPGLLTVTVQLNASLLEDLLIGASVSIDGVCLSVTGMVGEDVSFDIMQQTLDVTTLADLRVGYSVNIERSAKQGVEVGGHILSGHIDSSAQLVAIAEPENNRFVTYQLPAQLMKYVFEKGFIAINGCSLTVAKIDRAKQQFTVCYIPETLRVTTHGSKHIGDSVNIEIDRQTQTIVDTVERVLSSQPELFSGLLNNS
ncbi:riboflavin synthase [Dasania marina]|uniref:riboflavin synthase n=1 Tax=Dasania marina TaxID=471499 RepID=UPI0004BB3AB4|nr:riboflavin synthase [Dasania marina]